MIIIEKDDKMEKLELNISDNLIKLAKAIQSYGGTLYIVGGYVRNAYLNLANTDLDICGDLKYDTVLEIAQSLGYDAHIVNKKLGTVLIKVNDEEYEYTTFRKENYSKGGMHSPDDVEFVSDIKLDASRRDFTANCLYFNILSKEVIDVYGGINDINNHVLRCIKTPEEVFESDGLRILRLIRIASELGFAIDKQTKKSAKEYAYQLRDITAERVLKELKKIVVSDFKYDSTKLSENFLDNFNYINIFQYILNSNFANFQIGKRYRTNFFALPKNFRYIGFCILFLANYFNFKYVNPQQVIWAVNTYFGPSGLKESSKNLQTIITTYNLFQEVVFIGKKSYRRLIMNFYNADSEIKKFLESFIPNEYSWLKQDVTILRKRNVPLCLEELNISNMELIDEAKINKHITTKIKSKLLIDCLEEEISNTHDTLIAEAKYLNIRIMQNLK